MTRPIAFLAALAVAVLACEPRREPLREEILPVDEHAMQGAAAFGQYCALCHGADANGYAADHAPSLISPTFLESASDQFLTRGIREGRPGTAMAAYARTAGGPLDEEEVSAIIAFLRSGGPMRVPLPAAPAVGDAEAGEALYAETCQPCHGTRTDRGTAVHLANPTLLASASDAFLRWAIVHGRPGTPMPAFAGTLRDDQIDDLVAMLRSWATPPPPTRRAPPEPPPLDHVVINPDGKSPDLPLRDGRFVPIDAVKRALDAHERMVIIDARAASDWYTKHVPGSISVPYYMLSRLDGLPKDGTWILAYCACPHHASGVVVDELRRRGYPNTAILDEGILAWSQRNYPVDLGEIPDADPLTDAAHPPASATSTPAGSQALPVPAAPAKPSGRKPPGGRGKAAITGR